MEKRRKTKVGQVVSDKMKKTVVIAVESAKHHPLYKKRIKKTIRYKVHDEDNKSHVGDIVKIVETRPLSKEKCWRVAEILTRGKVVEVKPEEIT